MSDKELFKSLSEVCKTLGHPLRIEVIELLNDDELCFTDILTATGGLKSNLSQHLSVMTKAGVLNVRKVGQKSCFSLSSQKVAQACELMREVVIDNIKRQQSLLRKEE